MTQGPIGIIGGSGLYAMDGVTDLEEIRVETPYGDPSDAIMVGKLDGVAVAFLPRHGRAHLHPPHQINYRANIWALRAVGARWVLSVSAVGSMKEAIVPGDIVLVDQFIDRTRMRPSTFFEDGIAAHVSFAEPCCPVLRGALIEAAQDTGLRYQPSGTYVCIDGPQFSTRAESLLYRSWDVEVIGMTNVTECRLAREAQMAYATIAMATDYDCWHEGEEEVSVEAVVAVLKGNVDKAKKLLRHTVKRIPALPASATWSALKHAVMSRPDALSDAVRAKVGCFLDDTEYHGESS